MTLQDRLTRLVLATDALIAKIGIVNAGLDKLLVTLDGTVTPPPVDPPPIEPYPLEWDARLTEINVSVNRVPGAKYVMIAAWLTKNGNWDDVPAFAKKWQLDTLGGDHHIFGRCLDINGNPLMAKNFMMKNGGTAARQPEADGWANLPLAGQNWQPADGPGPYTWFPLNGDELFGFGMPHNFHWSFFAVFRGITGE